jgi:hypothetical protein
MNDIAALMATCPAWLDFEERKYNPAFVDGMRSAFRASSLPWDEFLDRAALFAAHEFSAGRMAFEQADGMVNELWGIWGDLDPAVTDRMLPDGPFYDVYDAFDAGEMWGDDRTRELLVERGLDKARSEGTA